MSTAKLVLHYKSRYLLEHPLQILGQTSKQRTKHTANKELNVPHPPLYALGTDMAIYTNFLVLHWNKIQIKSKCIQSYPSATYTTRACFSDKELIIIRKNSSRQAQNENSALNQSQQLQRARSISVQFMVLRKYTASSVRL